MVVCLMTVRRLRLESRTGLVVCQPEVRRVWLVIGRWEDPAIAGIGTSSRPPTSVTHLALRIDLFMPQLASRSVRFAQGPVPPFQPLHMPPIRYSDTVGSVCPRLPLSFILDVDDAHDARRRHGHGRAGRRIPFDGRARNEREHPVRTIFRDTDCPVVCESARVSGSASVGASYSPTVSPNVLTDV